MRLTSANFNSVGILDVNKVLLNSSAKVWEQLFLLALKIFGCIFPNVIAFLSRDSLTFVRCQTKAALKENDAGFLILSLINGILGVLYFEMTLFTESDNSLVSLRYKFSGIFKALVVFLKNWFNCF